MKAQFACPIDGCEAKFFTEVGLSFHVKGKHDAEEKKASPKTVAPVKAEPKKAKQPKDKPLLKKATKISKLNKLAKSRYKSVKLEVGQELTHKELCLLFPNDPIISIHSHIPANRIENHLSVILTDKKYKVTNAGETRGGFMRYILESPLLRVAWVEGDTPALKVKYRISYPRVTRR